MPQIVSMDRVLDTIRQLPAFPDVVLRVLQTLDDPQASLRTLTQIIEHDPIIAGHVLSLANRASVRPQDRTIDDVFTAVSIIGLSRVREAVAFISLAGFADDLAPAGYMRRYWAHSMAVAVCGVELAHYTPVEVGIEASLIACLLHDVGQLWLHRFEPERMQRVLQRSAACRTEPHLVESEELGVDHGTLGGWLARGWGLSEGIVKGIQYHHAPEKALVEPLVSVVHVGQALAQALDLAGEDQHPAIRFSSACCNRLELPWGRESQARFGRIEARTRHVFAHYAV